MSTNSDLYDLVIIGGSLSGSSLALLLKRWRPATRILLVEEQREFDHKVGEATVELSGFFLCHVLRLHDLLSREHLLKMGLRFWFTDDRGRRLVDMTEVSSNSAPSLPSYQLDRALLDESLLELCAGEGVEIARPAKVTSVQLDQPRSEIGLDTADGHRIVHARWTVDATGKRCLLGRQLGLIERFDEHKTAAAWGRWRGVLDMDGVELLGRDARAGSGLPHNLASRRLATNHFMGRGWWCWVIPLSGGETSIGIVHDPRIFQLPEGGRKVERYESFLRGSDGLRELLEGAELDGEDFRSYEHLAYRTRQYMGPGWALVGDAAAFLDPYYSPGLDHCAISVFATASLIEKDLDGELDAPQRAQAIQDHNERFERSYVLYFDALYRDKYEIFGDAELVDIAFNLDTAMYYLGVLHGPLHDLQELSEPPFGRDVPAVRLASRWMSFTNRRLVHIARRRFARGTYGRRNVGRQSLTSDFGEARHRLTPAHWKGLRMWARAEMRELWESAFGATRAR